MDRRGRRELLVFLLLLFVYGFFQQRPLWNENSRYDLVRAIVEQGTLRIDSFEENTGDKALRDGHWYSDKAPGTALLGVPVYALVTVTTWLAGGSVPPADLDAVQALAFVVSGLSTAVLAVLLLRFLGPRVGERWAVVVALAYGLGSMALPFATLFFGHAVAAAALFGSFYLLSRMRQRPGRWTAVVAGFLAGWAVLIEIPTVLGVAVLFVYALFIARGAAVGFVVGGLPLALVFLGYNWLAFGDPFSLGYANLLPGGFASGMSTGIMGVSWPKLDTLVDLLASPRGLLRLAPWFVVVPAGLLALRRRGARAEIIVSAAIVVLFLAYNAGYYLPFGGATSGPRFLLPALPFAAVLVGFAPWALRLLAAPLMVLACAAFFVVTVTLPTVPERFDDPLVELWLPLFLSGGFVDTGAWLRWGMPSLPAISVLLLGLAFGAVALGLSFARSAIADRVTGRGPIALALLVVAFSLPLAPVPPPALATLGAAGEPALRIVELGQAQIVVDGVQEFQLWARVENRGTAVAGSRTQFSVWDASGAGTWSAWYGNVSIPAGARRTIRMTWRPGDEAPGAYRYGFAVRDDSSGRTYADVLAQGSIAVGR